MKVKVRKVPTPARVEPVQHTPVRKPVDHVEAKIIGIMMREGAITTDEVYAIVKEHESDMMRGYGIAKGHLLRMMYLKHAKLDFSTDPHMYFLTPQGEQYIQNSYAPEVNQ